MRRWQNLGLAVTLLAVAVLVVSMVRGMTGGGGTAAPALSADEVPEPPADPVRVEVLNASGRAGLARDVMRALRDEGFDVVSIGNAPAGTDPARSRVVDRVGKPERARAVADALSVDSVLSQPDTTLYLDATVLIGRDWKAGETGTP